MVKSQRGEVQIDCQYWHFLPILFFTNEQFFEHAPQLSFICMYLDDSILLYLTYSDQKGSYRHYLNSQCTTTTTNIQHYLNSSLFQSDALCVEHSSRPNGGIWQYYDQDLFLRDPSVSVSCFKEGYLDGKRPHYMRSYYYYLLHIIEHLVLISKSLVLGWQYLCR